jgi:predicted DNA-binding transcriptional regulator AlpA
MELFDAIETRPAPGAMSAKPGAAGKPKPAAKPIVERPIVLSPREAAQYLGVSVSTLKNWRAKKSGPRWTHCGARLVAYRPADLEKFLDENSAKR